MYFPHLQPVIEVRYVHESSELLQLPSYPACSLVTSNLSFFFAESFFEMEIGSNPLPETLQYSYIVLGLKSRVLNMDGKVLCGLNPCLPLFEALHGIMCSWLSAFALAAPSA